MIRAITIVALGGALGSAARYMLSRAVGAYVHTAWPLATFAVNIIGCAAIGFISAVASRSPWMGENTRLFLTVGLCGGFTTFSTFCNEGLALMRGGHAMMAAAYAGASVAMGVLAAAAGMALGRWGGGRVLPAGVVGGGGGGRQPQAGPGGGRWADAAVRRVAD